MGKMTNVSWVVYEQDIYQHTLVILTNLFISVYILSIVYIEKKNSHTAKKMYT